MAATGSGGGADDDLAKALIASLGPTSRQPELPRPEQSHLQSILKQRHGQRQIIFWGAIVMSGLSFLLLLAMIAAQACAAWRTGRELLSEKIFMTVVVGIFGQIISVIVVISRAVWDDKNYARYLTGRSEI